MGIGNAAVMTKARIASIGLVALAAGALLLPHRAQAQNAISVVNQALLRITQQTSGLLVAGPPDVALQMALVDTAMYDAVNAATGSAYRPYAYAGGAVSGASADAAAYSAAATALTGIFGQSVWSSPTLTLPNSTVFNNSAANGLTVGASSPVQQIITALNANAAALSNAAGVTLGQNAAAAVLAATAITNAQANTAMIYGLMANTPSGSGTTPGVYVPPSASGGRPEMYPTWGGVTPVGETATQLLAAASTAALAGSTPGAPLTVAQSIGTSAYALDLLTTQCQGSGVAGTGTANGNAIAAACTQASALATAAAGRSVTLGPETVSQARAALFWNDPGTTIQPPGHWLQMVNTSIADAGLSNLQAARLSAGVSTAMADAGIAAWYDKYQNNLWRPITAIRNCTTSGYSWNSTLTAATCDSTWTSLIATPPHPDFVAGHPAFSGAAATAMVNFFGTDSIQAALGVASLPSVSNSYCNGGTPLYSTPTNPGDGVTIHGCFLATATAAYAAGTYYDSTGGCNAIAADTNPADANLNALTINGGAANSSPLICAITFAYNTFTGGSNGPLGSEYSRVVGGIHTPTAVEQALNIGNSIGAAVFTQNFQRVPEPGSLLMLASAGFGLIGVTRRRRR